MRVGRVVINFWQLADLSADIADEITHKSFSRVGFLGVGLGFEFLGFHEKISETWQVLFNNGVDDSRSGQEVVFCVLNKLLDALCVFLRKSYWIQHEVTLPQMLHRDKNFFYIFYPIPTPPFISSQIRTKIISENGWFEHGKIVIAKFRALFFPTKV
jgi:hypothetical protein